MHEKPLLIVLKSTESQSIKNFKNKNNCESYYMGHEGILGYHSTVVSTYV